MPTPNTYTVSAARDHPPRAYHSKSLLKDEVEVTVEQRSDSGDCPGPTAHKSAASSDMPEAEPSERQEQRQAGLRHVSAMQAELQRTSDPIPPLSDPFANPRLPQTSSFLKPNSCFIGSQQSGRSIYEVKVDLKEVDLDRSFMTGFLTIHGLTESHPEITTFFRAEIIGPRYSFYTNHGQWGSSKRNDLQHWGRFPSWRNLDFNTENDLYNHDLYQNAPNSEFLYMRWKEVFLVPDASIKDIRGASFAGFYYVCFNQLTGSINGLYFHKCSDKFQQLELSHVPDGGICPSYEYA